MPDADLVKAFRKGDKEAFSELVRRHSRPLTMMLLRMLRNEEDARDISQTAFMKAYEGLPRFMMGSSFKTWLYSIALNAARDHLRRKRPPMETDLYDRLPDSGEGAVERLDKARTIRKVREAVRDLPEKQRMTLQLRVYEDMDYKEIARVLGGTAGGARGNFFQAVKSLKTALG